MSAGLPGAGLAGVFFVLSALFAVPLEAVRTVQRTEFPRGVDAGDQERGAGPRDDRGPAAVLHGHQRDRQDVAEHGKSPLPKTLPIAPVLMALAVLVIVLLTAKALELSLRWRAALRARRGPVLLSTQVPSSAD